MVSNIVFENKSGEWTAQWVSQGNSVMELELAIPGAAVSVSANIEGMEPAVVATFSNPYGRCVIASLDIAAGLYVTVKSQAEVMAGKLLTEN